MAAGVDFEVPPRLTARAVGSNVRRLLRATAKSPEARERMAEGCLKHVGEIPEIETRRVRFRLSTAWTS